MVMSIWDRRFAERFNSKESVSFEARHGFEGQDLLEDLVGLAGRLRLTQRAGLY